MPNNPQDAEISPESDLEIVFGSSGQSIQESSLREQLLKYSIHGTLYFSYPIFDTADGALSADALLICNEYGLVLFDLNAPLPAGHADATSWLEEIDSRQDEIYRNMQAKLLQNRELVRRRSLVIEPNIITLYSSVEGFPEFDDRTISAVDNLLDLLSKFSPLPSEYKRPLNATIQRISTIKPRNKRENVKSTQSYGAKLQTIEKSIANLDSWQKKTAIAYPEGPQRIRGLAGSGKTIVLALKAAYLHARHPDWNIVVTYYSRSLRQQFRDLIRRFMYETKRDEPDWNKIQVIHSWGSRSEKGVYSEISMSAGVSPLSWSSARDKYGDRAFDGACKETLSSIKALKEHQPLYDAVLIDEAQDLPTSFFQMIYEATKSPKRIVWAYDELQNLGDYTMASPATLFGEDENGDPRITLRNLDGHPPQDIVLPVCYRNTPWALTVAHGIGFGVYRTITEKESTPLVQMFDDPALWEQIGYKSIEGTLSRGRHVKLQRKPECSPDFYSNPNQRIISPDESVQFYSFDNSFDQAEWIAEQIKIDLTERELLTSDILVIIPDAWTAKREYVHFSKSLRSRDIFSHLVGISSSRDEVFQDKSIAITHIHRAKGNEAPMVYVANSDRFYDGLQLAKKRNTLFTAITRSKAWVRVCGVGVKSRNLAEEFNKIKDNDFSLEFNYPTNDQIQKIRRIHRDRSDQEQKEIAQKITEMAEIIDLIRSGEMSIDSLPPETLSALQSILPKGTEE